MSSDPAEFDARLRQVIPPEGMKSRLREIPHWHDDDLDAQLAAIELPDGLLARLHDTVDDVQLDQAIAEVPVPPTALAKARDVAQRPAARQWFGQRGLREGGLRQRVARWAIAASLILLVWGGYLSAVVTVAGGSRPVASAEKVIWIDHGPLQLAARQPDSTVRLTDNSWQSPLLTASDEYGIPESLEPEVPVEWVSTTAAGRPLAEMQHLWQRYDSALSRQQFDLRWEWLQEQFPPAAERAAWELAAVAPSSTNASLWQSGAPRPQLFMLDNAPVFSPSNDRRLETSVPWLSQRTTTFDWAVARAAAGQFPAGERLHVHDFLAAIDYDSLRVPPGEVQWEVKAAVDASGLRHQGVRPLVLQIGVQAGRLARDKQAACEMQVALDVSRSMGAGRLASSQLALARFMQCLGEHDRVSLLPFNQQPLAATDSLSRRQQRLWHAELAALTASGTGDIGRGLHAALQNALARANTSRESIDRVVLITDSDSPGGDLQQAALRRLAAEAKLQQIELHVIHLGPSGESRRLLSQLAQLTGGECHSAGESREIYRALATILADRQPTVAHDVSFSVQFDPQQVAAYRLLGDHAPSIVAGESDSSVSIAAGESVVAVYEIWLQADATGNPFTAQAQWESVQSGKTVQRRKSFSVSELTMPAGADSTASSLWLTSLARATVDALRPAGSPAELRQRIDQVLQAAHSGPSSLTDRPDVRRMVRLLQDSREALGRPPDQGADQPR